MKFGQKRLSYQRKFLGVGKGLLLSALMSILPTSLVEAQITPDKSLSTSVEQQGESQLNIDGGAREGNNLFHSFEEFSVPDGIEAVFENAPDVENIFTRVTGKSASVINGILKTQGGANFFFVNPNGIVFGENARLDVGGSFVATTAESIKFEDGKEFAARDTQENPILTVSVPIGLQFDGNSGAIAVNGTGHQIASDTRFSPIDLENTEEGLSIKSEKTLAFIGDGITFSGGIASIKGGRIEIGSLNSGLVSLESTEDSLRFNFEKSNDYQDLIFSEQSLLNISGDKTGAISLSGKNILLSDKSFILVKNRGNSNSGFINVNASESLTLQGTSLDREISSGIRAESLAIGQTAEINIITKQIQLRDGAQIIGNTYETCCAIRVKTSGKLTVQSLDTTYIENR